MASNQGAAWGGSSLCDVVVVFVVVVVVVVVVIVSEVVAVVAVVAVVTVVAISVANSPRADISSGGITTTTIDAAPSSSSTPASTSTFVVVVVVVAVAPPTPTTRFRLVRSDAIIPIPSVRIEFPSTCSRSSSPRDRRCGAGDPSSPFPSSSTPQSW